MSLFISDLRLLRQVSSKASMQNDKFETSGCSLSQPGKIMFSSDATPRDHQGQSRCCTRDLLNSYCSSQIDPIIRDTMSGRHFRAFGIREEPSSEAANAVFHEAEYRSDLRLRGKKVLTSAVSHARLPSLYPGYVLAAGG